jgi:SAM-dependent methyltransferase
VGQSGRRRGAGAVRRQEVAALRRALEGAGYHEERLRSELKLRSRFVAPARGRHDLYLERVGDAGAFATLTRLFLLETAVDPAAAADALAPLALPDAAALGLVRLEPAAVVPLVRIAPFEGLLIVSDKGEWDETDVPADFVPGLTGAGTSLARLTPREHVGAALDLGTGSGIHALLAARRADRVVATDVNPRALAFAGLNAELNGLTNVELRAGDLFEPVAGERFDLIVANPPFVVGPDRRYVFRDGGPGFVERVVRGAAAVLHDGGVAVVSVGWAHDGADAWGEPRRWLERGGCDAVVLRFVDLDLLSNGWSYTRDAEVSTRWANALRGGGFAAVSYGEIALRRRAGGGRIATVDLVGKDTPGSGAHVARMLRNLEWLDANEERLASAPFEPAEGLELRLVEQLGASADEPRPARLALRRGLPVVVDADDALVSAVRRGTAGGDPALVPAVRTLFENGLLTPT